MIADLSETRLLNLGEDLRQELDREVELLARTYAPDGCAERLVAAAVALEEAEGLKGPGRTRALLWAALLRRRAAAA